MTSPRDDRSIRPRSQSNISQKALFRLSNQFVLNKGTIPIPLTPSLSGSLDVSRSISTLVWSRNFTG